MDSPILDLISSIIFITIFFYVVRFAVRANQLQKLLAKISEDQSRQILLLEAIVKEKTSATFDDNFYYQSYYLEQAQKIKASELLKSDGSIDDGEVIKLVRLFKGFKRDLTSKGYSIETALDTFKKVIDKLAADLTEQQRIQFFTVYNDARMNAEIN